MQRLRERLDTHGDRCRQVLEAQGWFDYSQQQVAVKSEMDCLRQEIFETPARSARGVLAKFKLALTDDEYERALKGSPEKTIVDPDADVIVAIVQDLERMGASG